MKNKPSIALVMPVIDMKEDTLECLDSFSKTAHNWEIVEKLIVDNGSNPPVVDWPELDNVTIIRNDINIGVLPALQAAYLETESDFIFYTHNDVRMFEMGWDSRVRRILSEAPRIGVAGFFGSKGIGTPELYKVPYEMKQFVRWGNVSNCYRMDAVHSFRPVSCGEWEKVAVIDGFSMIVSRRFLDENGGFDMNLPPHHNYDNHTCLQAIDKGYNNIVIGMDCVHLGGKTDVNTSWNEPFGKSKDQIHADAHYPYYYEYWKPGNHKVCLPYEVDK